MRVAQRTDSTLRTNQSNERIACSCVFRKDLPNLRRVSCNESRRPAELEGIAAGGADDVEEVAGEEEVGNDFALHGLHRHLREGNAAVGDDRFIHAEQTVDGEGKVLECFDEAYALFLCDAVHLNIRIDIGDR